MNKITITKESLDKTKDIMAKMSGDSFHDHIHILYDLRTSLGSSEITYLEIGAYAGASASLLASHPYPTKVYSIDLGDPVLPAVVEQNVAKFKNPISSFEYIQGNSQHQNVIDHTKALVPEVDILFIDGDHTSNGVKMDFQNYYYLVKEGGYIVFDDYNDVQHSPEVKAMVDTIASQAPNDFYEVIGSLKYSLLAYSNVNLTESNEFIIRRRKGNENGMLSEIVTMDTKTSFKSAQTHKKQNRSKAINQAEDAVEITDNNSPEEDDKLSFGLFVLEKKLINVREKRPNPENDRKIKQLERSIQILKNISQCMQS